MPMTEETREQFEKEEQAYWRQREELLKQYRGRWVALVGGQVVAVGDNSRAVIQEAYEKTGSKTGYAAHVGHEAEVYRLRQITAGYYDPAYHRAMPKVIAEARHMVDTVSTEVDFVVDTGADLTVLRNAVADELNLWDSAWRTARIAGVGAAAEARPLYATIVRLAEHDSFVEVDCRDDLGEDILGRDVINEYSLTVCAKRDEVTFEWVDDVQP